MMADFGRWVFAVIRHYWFVLGGASLGVVGLFVQQYSPNGRLEPWPFYALCAAGFVGAIFLAWREEYRKVEELGKPKFVVEVHGASAKVSNDHDSTLVILAARVTNEGADSAILGYGVEYFNEDGNKAIARVVALDDDYVFNLPRVFSGTRMLDALSNESNHCVSFDRKRVDADTLEIAAAARLSRWETGQNSKLGKCFRQEFAARVVVTVVDPDQPRRKPVLSSKAEPTGSHKGMPL
jgi:hypothetical protein